MAFNFGALPGCQCVMRPSSEFVRALLRSADEEDRWRNPFVIVPQPSMCRQILAF
jgi:hypothetical protein